MSTLLLPTPLVMGPVLAAQPDFNRNYCGFAPDDSIDLTNDGIPDLVVLGFRSGTDDVPSSSGNCHLHVVNLKGTSLLNSRDEHGRWRLKASSMGDGIRAVPTRPLDDLQTPVMNYTDGSIPVAYWGYGGQAEQFTEIPNLNDQYYVFRPVANGRTWHGSFSIEPPVQMDQVKVRVEVLVPVDRAFVMQYARVAKGLLACDLRADDRSRTFTRLAHPAPHRADDGDRTSTWSPGRRSARRYRGTTGERHRQ